VQCSIAHSRRFRISQRSSDPAHLPASSSFVADNGRP
jgi:hypothetical protein